MRYPILTPILISCLFVQTALTQDSKKPSSEDIKRAIKEMKLQLCKHLDNLLEFKDEPQFKSFGFSQGGPYFVWLKAVEDMHRNGPRGPFHPIPSNLRIAPSQLMTLGMEYKGIRGESEYTRTVLPELKEAIAYDDYLAEKRRVLRCKELTKTRKWTDRNGKTIQAACIGYSDGKITLKNVEGKEIVVPFDRLSADDQSLIDDVDPFGSNDG